jgi:hypothetical protein
MALRFPRVVRGEHGAEPLRSAGLMVCIPTPDSHRAIHRSRNEMVHQTERTNRCSICRPWLGLAWPGRTPSRAGHHSRRARIVRIIPTCSPPVAPYCPVKSSALPSKSH